MDFLYTFANSSILVRLVCALVILLIFLIGKRFLSHLALKFISLIKIKHTTIDSQFLDRLQQPFNCFFILTGIFIALSVSPFVHYTTISEEHFILFEKSIPVSIVSFKFLERLYQTAVVLLITWAVYDLECIYEEVISNMPLKLPFVDNTLFIRFTAKLIRLATIVLGIFIALYILFPAITTGILTGVGVGGVALAFIGKDMCSNILSGFVIMMDRPFIIGDWIEVQGVEGIVEDISFRSTRIRTFTQGMMVIPNATIGNANIINWSRMERRRVKFDLGVAYNTPIDQLNLCKDRIKAIIAKTPHVQEGTALVAFESFGDSSLNIQVIYFSLLTDYASYLQIKESINLEILALCEELGIEIAFPTQTVYIAKEQDTAVQS